jgi:hypothetical protein
MLNNLCSIQMPCMRDWLRLACIILFSLPTAKSVSKSSKALPVTGRGGPLGCDMLRFPHFLDNRLIDGGKVVSPTHRPPFTPKNIPRIFLILISVRG